MDIRPPARRPMPPSAPQPIQRPVLPPVQQSIVPPPQQPQPISQSGLSPKKKRSKKKLALIIIASILGLGVIAVAAIWFWYQSQLAPVDSTNTEKIIVKIEEGTPGTIATTLKEEGVIRDETAFLWYTRM